MEQDRKNSATLPHDIDVQDTGRSTAYQEIAVGNPFISLSFIICVDLQI
jgi:hypothetical protein